MGSNSEKPGQQGPQVAGWKDKRRTDALAFRSPIDALILELISAAEGEASQRDGRRRARGRRAETRPAGEHELSISFAHQRGYAQGEMVRLSQTPRCQHAHRDEGQHHPFSGTVVGWRKYRGNPQAQDQRRGPRSPHPRLRQGRRTTPYSRGPHGGAGPRALKAHGS